MALELPGKIGNILKTAAKGHIPDAQVPVVKQLFSLHNAHFADCDCLPLCAENCVKGIMFIDVKG